MLRLLAFLLLVPIAVALPRALGPRKPMSGNSSASMTWFATSTSSSRTATTWSWSAAASGGAARRVDTAKVDIWHFENGRVTRFMEMFDSLAFARAVGAV